MPSSFETYRFRALNALATQRFGEMTPGEKEVLRLSSSTEYHFFEASGSRLEVSGAFIRWLATDEDAITHIDPLGIRVANSTIWSPINLSFCQIPIPLQFQFCGFQDDIFLESAAIPFLRLVHCAVDHGIFATGLKTNNSVFLRQLSSKGPIYLLGAQIGGDLDCAGTVIECLGRAFTVDRAKVNGAVFLNEGFMCSGEVRFLGTQIDGQLDCGGAKLKATPFALSADGASVRRSVYLDNGFSCPSIVRLLNVQIGGNLDCTAAQIDALECGGLQITGDLIWRGISQPGRSNLVLSGASIRAVHDERASWPDKGGLHIQDFVYQDLFLHQNNSVLKLAPADRVEWLKLQPDSELSSPQPWMQLAKLIQAYGDADGAKWVVYKYQRQEASNTNALRRVATWPYDWLEEQPLRIGLPIAILGLIGSFIFWRAKRIQAMAPTGKDALAEFEAGREIPAGYPLFNPVVYTVENVLPVIKLGQDSAWAPNHLVQAGNWLPERPAWLRRFASRWRLTRYISRLTYHRLAVVRWALIIFGWALALILAAAIGSRFKSLFGMRPRDGWQCYHLADCAIVALYAYHHRQKSSRGDAPRPQGSRCRASPQHGGRSAEDSRPGSPPA